MKCCIMHYAAFHLGPHCLPKVLIMWFSVYKGLTLIMLYILCTTLLPDFYPVNLQVSIYKYIFSCGVENSVDPDQMALLEAR